MGIVRCSPYSHKERTKDDNEEEVLEIILHYVELHHVEVQDRYIGSVCVLDLIVDFHKAYFILDEILVAGELQESSKKTVARLIVGQDALIEDCKGGGLVQSVT